MSCRSCEDRPGVGEDGSTNAAPSVWGMERISGLRCRRCGATLGAEDIARLLFEKQSQLERFGLLQRPERRRLPFVRLESD